MTIQITQPEIEAIIKQRMASGMFRDAAEVVLQALRSSPEPKPNPAGDESLEQVFSKMRGLLTEEEFRKVFSPNPTAPPLAPVEAGFGKRLVEACAGMRGLMTDEEIDTIFRREPVVERPLEF